MPKSTTSSPIYAEAWHPYRLAIDATDYVFYGPDALLHKERDVLDA